MLPSVALPRNSTTTLPSSLPLNLRISTRIIRSSLPFRTPVFLKQPSPSSLSPDTSSALRRSLRLLEWDKLCDAVASFAGTPLGREAAKAQLGSLSQSYEESLKLLEETNAAVEIHKYGGGSGLDFTGIDVALVKSGVLRIQKGLAVDGNEAIAIAVLLQFSRSMQCNLETAIRADADWYERFMPLSEMIMEMVINQSVIKSIQQVIEEDGSVKDSACPSLKSGRQQVEVLEKRIYQLLASLVREEVTGTSVLEVSSIDGRLCIESDSDQPTSLNGLLLSSHSEVGSLIEPLAVVPLNDELQQAKMLVAKAEADVLMKLSKKIKVDIGDVETLLLNIIKLDVINARAIFSVSLGGTFPKLTSLENKSSYFSAEALSSKKEAQFQEKRNWMLYLPKAYHPLLLWQHHLSLQKARKRFKSATSDIRRRKLQGELPSNEETNLNLSYLETQVSKLEESHPVPVDFYIDYQTRVLVISGPNAGGKTICLKTVGLAGMMAKAGLYVLASEPVRIPWFDSVFADIGDEQSLSQSLSTFSGHLKQISEIQAGSTFRSLVLLDEVGGGTNPLEGTALAMSLLEYFASSAMLTICTTHLGELKTLKYSNNAFENACMEFDEVNLKPTYKILFGIPGRSNAISIAERLGLPIKILDDARESCGSASTTINSVILDMERFKQESLKHFQETQRHLKLAGETYENLLATQKSIIDHSNNLRYKKMQKISDLSSMARSLLRKKVRHLGAAATQSSKRGSADKNQKSSASSGQHIAVKTSNQLVSSSENVVAKQSPSEKRTELPKVGDVVHLPSLRKKATVLAVDPSKEDILVQAGNIKLKLKLHDVAR